VIVYAPRVCGYWGAAQNAGSQTSRACSRLAARADEILAKAETMTDADAREMMRAVAVSYAKLAERLEEEAVDA
jgi:hypothetical protein